MLPTRKCPGVSWWPLPHCCGGRTIHSPLVLRTSSPTSPMSSGIPRRNRDGGRNVEVGMDDEARQALRAEGLDSDDPAVAAAIDNGAVAAVVVRSGVTGR